MRKVLVKHHVSKPNPAGTGRNIWVVEDRCEATFHEFGVDYEEFESVVGNFSVAIVEFDDGSVEGIPLNFIKFLN